MRKRIKCKVDVELYSANNNKPNANKRISHLKYQLHYHRVRELLEQFPEWEENRTENSAKWYAIDRAYYSEKFNIDISLSDKEWREKLIKAKQEEKFKQKERAIKKSIQESTFKPIGLANSKNETVSSYRYKDSYKIAFYNSEGIDYKTVTFSLLCMYLQYVNEHIIPNYKFNHSI